MQMTLRLRKMIETRSIPTPSGVDSKASSPTFGRFLGLLVVLHLLLVGGVMALQGFFVLIIAPDWEPPPDVTSWRALIGFYMAFGLVLLLIGLVLSRLWKQRFWTRFSLASILVGTMALCSVMALMTRPGAIINRELVSMRDTTWEGEACVHYTVQYEFRSPGWSVLQPTTGYTFSNTIPEFNWVEVDRRALAELRRYYYGTDENIGTDLLRCLVIVLGSMYGTELLLHRWRCSRIPSDRADPPGGGRGDATLGVNLNL
jgi:hypothetical protein